jgi:hypothetical protein
MSADATIPSLLGRVARAGAWAALVYWGAYALVTPVTTIDSQMYNLTRVELAARGGLFDNGYFTSVFHVIFPWTFDALHLPFLQLGWGYALPSYLCLAGTCLVAYTLVRARFGADAAWVAVASLLSLTCLVYQGTSTKNDIPVLFAGAVWLYARWRWRQEARDHHLVWMVLAIGFMAGAKTTGVLYGLMLSLWTIGELRGRRRLSLQVVGGLAITFLLFGSVETYVESVRLYGHPLGPPPLLHRMGNHDGIRGGLANLTRHVTASVYVGPTDFRDGQTGVNRLAGAARTLLAWTGLTDAGTDPRFPDSNLFFSQSGLEELSGFGPMGTLAMAVMLGACLCWRPRAVWWRLAMAALLGVILVSLTVAYTSWTNRYLIGAYALGTLALVCLLWETEFRGSRILRWGCALLALAAMAAAPLLSFNRRPADLLAALRDRDRFETATVPVVGRVRERLRDLHARSPQGRVYLVVTDESVVLPLVEDRALGVVMVTKPVFNRLAAARRLDPGDLVVLESPSNLAMLLLVEAVTAPNVFSLNQTSSRFIYQVVASPARR